MEVFKTILVFLAFLISFVPSVAKKLFRLVRVRLNEVKPNNTGLIMCWVEKRNPIYGLMTALAKTMRQSI